MIVVIPYTNCYHDGAELRFAIRSMVKHFKAMTGLIVVGDKPSWFKGGHIPLLDIPARKEYSMYIKMMTALNYNKECLYSNDDIFALKDFDETLPNYYSGTCGEAAKEKTGRYKMQYKNCPEEWLNFDIHVPIIMWPFEWGSDRKDFDKPIKTTYANSAGLKGTELDDLKFGNPHTYGQIKSIIDEKPFFSTSPFSQNEAMMDVLNELYPNKSQYEK